MKELVSNESLGANRDRLVLLLENFSIKCIKLYLSLVFSLFLSLKLIVDFDFQVRAYKDGANYG